MTIKLAGSTFLLLLLVLQVFGQNTSQQIYLSGKSFDDTKTWDFYCSNGNNSGAWSKIEVPSQWEQQGFGEYTYGRWYKINGKKPSDETGHYKTTFLATKEWKNKVVEIVFEGVMTDTKVLINGKQAGEIHQGGFYRFKYDICDKLKLGEENILEVLVSKHSADKTVNAAERMADWWLFGGIYRPVYLEIKPKEHISQLRLNPKFDGTLDGIIELKNIKNDAVLNMKLTSADGNSFPIYSKEIIKKSDQITISTKWENIDPWTPEMPNLYDITFELIRNNETIHKLTERIGFRTIEVRPQDGIYCNNTKIILKGINRHTFWPESGRCTSKEISVMDVNLIKEMNMNAVRTHYPPDTHFLDACDSLGLFFIDELAGWQNAYRTEVGAKLVTEMIDRDLNHPSVIIWSNGNEGGWNYNTDQYFEKLDPQKRDVIHPWADFDDIDTHHYPQYQTGVHRFNNGDKIFMPTEFLHSLYDEGGGAGLDDFWAKWNQSPYFAGGFIWAYNDDAVKRSDTGLLDSEGSLAPDGIVGPYREKEGNFFTIKEIWAPIQFKTLNINSSFNGEFYITNQYLFTNLNQCDLTYSVTQIPGPWQKNQTIEEIAKGKIILPSIEPKETRIVKMQLPDNFFEGDVLTLTASDAHGKEIYTWTWPIRLAKQYIDRKQATNKIDAKAYFSEKENELTLHSSSTAITFEKSTGLITQVNNKNENIPFNGGPVPVGMKAVADHFKVRTENNIAVFTVWYKGGIDSIRWEMHPDGKIKMSMLALNKATNDGGFDGGYIQDKIELWGITFNYPDDAVSGMTWFGKGPYRVWKNRQKGTGYNLWHKDYNNTITGEAETALVYPEFKGYHANIYWARLESKSNQPITFVSESNGLFLRLLTPEEPKNKLVQSMPIFPEGDISFLYEINPIHAFKPVSQMGPQSEPSSIRIKSGDEGISMIIWFDFNK